MKTESVKSRTACSNMDTFDTYVTAKILKKQDNTDNLYINLVQNIQIKNIPVNFQNSWTKRKSFCFYTESSQLSSTLYQRLYLALYWKKCNKNDYYISLIMLTHKNSRGKYCVVSQKRFSLMPFQLGMMISMMLT